MGGKCDTYGGEEKYMRIWWVNTEERKLFEDLAAMRGLKRVMRKCLEGCGPDSFEGCGTLWAVVNTVMNHRFA
jgi:hypothetical protein